MTLRTRHQLPFWLHSRYVLAGTAVLGLALALAAAGFIAYRWNELQQAALARDELFARVLEDQANRTFNGVEVALNAAADAARLQRNEGRRRPDQDTALALLLRQSLQGLPYLRSISLVDAQGDVLASSNPVNTGRRIPRQRLLPASSPAGLGRLLPGRDLADLAPSASVPAAVNLLPLVLPLDRGPGGDWMVATLNPDYFSNQYELLLADTPIRAAMMSYDGQLIAASSGVGLAAGQRRPAHPVFSQYLPGREHGQLFGAGLDGEPSFTAFRSASRQPLVLLVETPATVVRADLRAIGLTVAAATAVLLALLGALGALAWRSLRSHEAVSGDLQAAQGSLAARDAFTDRLFQVSPIPMVVKNTSGHFLRVNKAWTDLTGVSAERAIGANLGRLYPAQLAAPHEVQEQIAIASGQPVSYEEQILDSDGLPRDVMIQVTPYTDAEGQIDGVIGCLMDVTEFREAAQRTLEAKDAAERANAIKSEFLANISHELRTPLQAILGFSELGGVRSRDHARIRGMFDDIHAAGNRMLNLVNDLLDLSRLESSVGDIRLAAIDIDPVLRAVVQELQPLAQARRLRLSAPPLPPAGWSGSWVQADALRLQQVLRNVLANAIRFAPEGSDIVLDWHHEPANRLLLISVRDHGPGIPPDELESIFGAFVQSSRTKDGSGGTGLGLAICRKIMDAHHGSILAHNHPQGGAVFEIRLPAQWPPTQSPGVAFNAAA